MTINELHKKLCADNVHLGLRYGTALSAAVLEALWKAHTMAGPSRCAGQDGVRNSNDLYTCSSGGVGLDGDLSSRYSGGGSGSTVRILS